jgi:hypothetical protein
MIELGTPTRKGGQSHRSSTIDLVISSNSAQVSMVDIAIDLYTGSDHETLYWEINDGGNGKWETHTVATPRWKIRKPVKDGEEGWQQEWINRICPDGKPSLLSPLDQISVFEGFLDDIFGRKRWSRRAKRWWTTELEDERDILAEARRTIAPSSDQFKQARNRWLRESPVLFGLTCGRILKELPDGCSYVDDCACSIPFDSLSDKNELASKVQRLLNKIQAVYRRHGMELDEKKTELAVIYKANQKRKQWEMEANRWSMRWHDKTIQFNKGNTRWLGYHLDRCLNWRPMSIPVYSEPSGNSSRYVDSWLDMG